VESGSSDRAADPSPSSEPPPQDPPKVHATAAPPPPPAPRASPSPNRALTLAASFCGWLMRPRVRVTVTGVILLLVGGLLVTSSVWTLPLMIVGALMVVIAWIGRRLEGRFVVEWGEEGTQLECRAKIKAPQTARPVLPRTSSTSRYLETGSEPEPQDAEVVEGEAHTVEIEVGALNALIAAAEGTQADTAQTDPSAQAKRNLRVADSGGRSPEAG